MTELAPGGGRARVAGRAGLILAALLLVSGLGGCTTFRLAHGAAGAIKPAPGLTVQGRIERAVALLGEGKRAEARAEVVQVLVDQPGHPAARSLLGQIDINPKVLLGEKNYPYVVKPGDTISGLADRLLGDRLMFYALARYNGMDRATSLAVGRTLLIPGAPKKAAPPPPLPAPPTVHKAPPPPPPPPPPPAPPKAAAPAADPARARELRGAGLRKMSTGEIDAAVALLQQALALSPGSPVIKNDLARARRIQATLRAH